MITLAFMESKQAYLEELKSLAQYFNLQFSKIFQGSPLMNFHPNRQFFALSTKCLHYFFLYIARFQAPHRK